MERELKEKYLQAKEEYNKYIEYKYELAFTGIEGLILELNKYGYNELENKNLILLGTDDEGLEDWLFYNIQEGKVVWGIRSYTSDEGEYEELNIYHEVWEGNWVEKDDLDTFEIHLYGVFQKLRKQLRWCEK